jgi:hypothetical protein
MGQRPSPHQRHPTPSFRPGGLLGRNLPQNFVRKKIHLYHGMVCEPEHLFATKEADLQRRYVFERRPRGRTSRARGREMEGQGKSKGPLRVRS